VFLMILMTSLGGEMYVNVRCCLWDENVRAEQCQGTPHDAPYRMEMEARDGDV
jgi:hypothetical protein